MKMRIKLAIVLFVTILLFSLTFSTDAAAGASPEMTLDTKLRYMGDRGGGEVWVTLEGELASKFRERIDTDSYIHQSSGGFGDGTVSGAIGGGTSELSKYVELIEDRLEGEPEDDMPLENYQEIYKGMLIRRTGENQGANLVDTKGLIGSSTDSTSKIELKIEFKTENMVIDNDVLFSDAYVIYYALFGNLSGAGDYVCQDNFEIMIVGFSSYSTPDMAGDGELTHYRHPVGEYILYENSYNILEGRDNDRDTVQYQEFSFIQSPIILLIVALVLGIMTMIFPRYQANKNKKKKKLWLRVLVIVLFIVLVLLFIFGLDGLYIWSLGIIFAIVSAVISVGIYSLGWMKTEDLEDTKPESGADVKTDLHEQGIVFFEAGDYEEAKNRFGKALVKEPENEVIWNDLGYIFMKQERHQEALKCFNRALKIKPSYKAARTNLQQAMAELRKVQ